MVNVWTWKCPNWVKSVFLEHPGGYKMKDKIETEMCHPVI